MTATGTLLYMEKVSVSFDGFKALNDLSLAVAPGEMRAIIGPNGAGKTTMMDVITGKTRPDTGFVLFDEVHDLKGMDEAAIANLGIGRKFQKPTVFESQSVEDNFVLALQGERGVWPNLFGKARAREAERIEELLALTRLDSQRDTLAGSLSHGQKQWLEIGMLLVQNADVLLLDEPVAGMSHEEREETGNLLRRIGAERTVVVVEHDMDFMREFATSVTVLARGQVIAEGSVAEVQANPRVQEVYLGTAAVGSAESEETGAAELIEEKS